MACRKAPISRNDGEGWRNATTLRLMFGTMFAAVALSLASAPSYAQQQVRIGDWIGTWTASPQPVWGPDFPVPLNMPRNLRDQTLRQIVHVSIGGSRVRIVLSNEYGDQPMRIGAAHVALAGNGAAIAPGSDHGLTFGGQPTIVVPPGAPVVSDPVDLSVPAGGNLAVSLYLPDTTPLTTIHWEGVQTAYISDSGNHAADPEIKATGTMKGRAFLTEVMVPAANGAHAVVVFGDSITDGANSTPDANRRWPDALAARLHKAGHDDVAVLDEAISGQRVLSNRMAVNALAAFGPEVLSQPHARTVVLMMGINDIGWPDSGLAPEDREPTAQEVIQGYKQLIARAHMAGLRILGATLTPFEDAFKGMAFPGYYTPEKEQIREEVNRFIRSGAFDGVIDFDKAVQDPANPKQIRADFNSGDHLHPNDAGYAAMADAVNLALIAQPNH